MAQVHMHPDGSVLIRVDGETYCAATEQFAEDFGESFPALPPCTAECLYDQGNRLMLVDHNNRLMIEHPMPAQWPEGDRILEQARSLLEKQRVRLKNQEEAMKARIPQVRT